MRNLLIIILTLVFSACNQPVSGHDSTGAPETTTTALSILGGTEDGIGFLQAEGYTLDGADVSYKGLSLNDEAETDITVTVGKLALGGLVMVEAAPEIDAMHVEDISIVDENSARAKLDHIGLMNPSAEMVSLLQKLLAGDMKNTNFLAKNISFDVLKADGLSLVSADENMKLSLENFIFSELGDDAIQSITLKGLELEASEDSNVAITLDNFSLNGARLEFLKAAAIDEGNINEIMGNIFLSQNMLDPGFDGFALRNLDIVIEDMARIKTPNLDSRIERKNGGDLLTSSEKGSAFIRATSKDEDNGFNAFLSQLGYDGLEITYTAKNSIDMASNTAASEGANITLKDGFALNASYEVSGINALNDLSALDSEDEMAMLGLVSQLGLNNLEFSYADQSFFNRILGVVAEQQGQDTDSLRTQILGMIPLLNMSTASMGIDPAIMTDISAALTEFIQTPGTLTIAINPETPIGVADFSDPSTLTKERLGFSISHKAP